MEVGTLQICPRASSLWHGEVTVSSNACHRPVARMCEVSINSKTFPGSDKCQETVSPPPRLSHRHNWVDKPEVESSALVAAESYTGSLTSWSQTGSVYVSDLY